MVRSGPRTQRAWAGLGWNLPSAFSAGRRKGKQMSPHGTGHWAVMAIDGSSPFSSSPQPQVTEAGWAVGSRGIKPQFGWWPEQGHGG